MGPTETAPDILLHAARDFGLWPEALRSLASRFHSDHGFAYLVTPETTHAFASRGSEEILAAVVKDKWHERNPRMGRGLQYARSGPVGLLTDWRLFSPQEIAREPFEQEFARRHDAVHYAGTFIPFAENSFLVLSFERSRKRGEFWGSELADVTVNIEQARRSIMYALATQSQLVTGLVNGLGTDGSAHAWLSASGAVRYASAAFMALADRFIGVRNGKLYALNGDDVGLQRLISAAATGGQANERIVLQDITSSGEIAYVRAIPMRTLNLGIQGFADILLSIEVKRSREKTLMGILRQRFGLTKAEAQLALRLDQGHHLREAARREDISYETARTRLKVIFNKLDVRRQSELLRILDRLSSP